jgi:hypothetical protein
MSLNTPPGINPADEPGLPGGNSPSFLPPLPVSSNANVGSIPDNNSSSSNGNIVNDQLANLLEFVFDDTAFPGLSFKEAGSHDLAMHKYPNLDVYRLENTGRNSSVFTIRGIFTNNIYPSANETWVSGNLFPNTFNHVLTSLYDTTKPIKTMVHPYLGSKSVMVQNWTYDFIGKGPRDGVFMDITFIETLAATALSSTISPPNPSANLSNSASILDTLIGGSGVPFQPPGMSLSNFFGQLAATVRNIMAIPSSVIGSLEAPIFQISVGINQVLSAPQFYQAANTSYVNNNGMSTLIAGVNSGNPNPVTYNFDALQAVYRGAFSLNTAQHNNANQFLNATTAFLLNLIYYYTTLNNVNTAQIKLNLYLMLGQLQLIQQTLFQNSNQWAVQLYIAQTPTTLRSLSNILNNTVDQLTSLNPNLNKTLLVPGNTAISYFQS